MARFDCLVIGAGRGGTSLLAGLLDSHPQLTVDFELGAVAFLMGEALEGDDAARFDVRTARFIEACAAAAARHGSGLWGNKITTEQLAGLEDHRSDGRHEPVDVLETFFNRVLAAQKLVFILRDGRTCVRSKMTRTGQTLETACERWLYSVKVYQFLRENPRAVSIRYESLVTEPEATLDAVCAFLGVAYDPVMLRGTQNAKMLRDYRYPGLVTSKLELRDIPPGCEERLAGALRSCGYLPSGD